MKTCVFKGCDNAHKAKGLCAGHYQQARRGVSLSPLQGTAEYEATRHHREGDCIIWDGAKDRWGYGLVSRGGSTMVAHKWYWLNDGREIPPGMELDHKCRREDCINLDHLRLLTSGENCQNHSGPRADNKSGYRGVYLHPRQGWTASVSVAGERRQVYGHPSAEAANETAVKMRMEMHSYNDMDKS